MCNVHDDGAAVPVKFDKTQYVVIFFYRSKEHG